MRSRTKIGRPKRTTKRTRIKYDNTCVFEDCTNERMHGNRFLCEYHFKHADEDIFVDLQEGGLSKLIDFD